jgi:hypothetical protein
MLAILNYNHTLDIRVSYIASQILRVSYVDCL